MNTQYFDAVIREVNEITPYLTKYSSYINQAVAASSSCAELTNLAIQAGEKLATTSSKLTEISTKASADVAGMQSDITAALALIAPLMVAPTDLSSLLTWAGKIINIYAGPYANYLVQETTLVTQLANITSAVSSLASAIASTTTAINASIAAKQASLGCV